MSTTQPGTYYPQGASSTYPQYSPMNQQAQMQPTMVDNSGMIGDFTAQPNVGSPTQFHTTSSQQVSPEMTTTMDQSSTLGSTGNPSFDPSFFDPNDPSLFNFNISDLNFGNHYGALEFGMLGHMSSGALNTPDVDVMNPMSHNQGSMSYDGTPGFPTSGFGYSQQFQPWQNVSGARQGSSNNLWAVQNNGMDAFAVGEHTASITGMSPQSHNQDFYQSSTVSPETQFAQPNQSQQPDLLRQSFSHQQHDGRKPGAFPSDVNQSPLKKRRRDTSEIYTSVQAPYPYTQGFHSLTASIQKRFPSKKVYRIAKALASIRPSFISCNKNLNHDDLIFMEKCFQRTLCEYEEFVNHYGTPTLICRRTGEVAAVSKEFSLVTGWRRDVLLGKEPNLNVNNSNNGSGTQTGSSTRGAATPRIPNIEPDPGRPQPVFLAELLDEDSVVQFYEDFSELAFGASRSSIIGSPCSLLKYKTKDDPGWGPEERLTKDGKRVKKQSTVKGEPLIKGEAGVNALGDQDGRVNAMMCWTVKRDVFDIPMLIVMNVRPLSANCLPYAYANRIIVPSSYLMALQDGVYGQFDRSALVTPPERHGVWEARHLIRMAVRHKPGLVDVTLRRFKAYGGVDSAPANGKGISWRVGSTGTMGLMLYSNMIQKIEMKVMSDQQTITQAYHVLASRSSHTLASTCSQCDAPQQSAVRCRA